MQPFGIVTTAPRPALAVFSVARAGLLESHPGSHGLRQVRGFLGPGIPPIFVPKPVVLLNEAKDPRSFLLSHLPFAFWAKLSQKLTTEVN